MTAGLHLLHPTRDTAPRPYQHLLEPGAIQTVFQPIVDVATGAIVSAEALSRFGSRRLHVSEVFAIAEVEGWAPRLEAACLRAAMANRAALPSNVMMSVNVSPDMLSHPSVQRVLRGDLSGLAIEITENAARNIVALQDALADIRRRGGKIVIDDASSGYAGLLRLSTLAPGRREDRPQPGHRRARR